MAYTYALNVIRRCESNGRIAFSGVSRIFAAIRGTAESILASLDLSDPLAFIHGDDVITSVPVDRGKIIGAKIDPKKQTINGDEVGREISYQTEFGELLAAQRDLLADPEARVFLEID
jgi:hypothetical protein